MSVNYEVWEALDDSVEAPLSRLVDERRLEQEVDRVYDELRGDADRYAADREDLRDVSTYAIDPAGARDRDDAFSIDRDYEDGSLEGYTAHVHIVDVPHYVTEDSTIDRYAEQQGFTVYGAGTNHMLPEPLVEEIGFVEQEDRLANTIEYSFDADGQMEGYDIYRSVVNVDRTLTYDDADHYVKQPKNAPWANRDTREMIRSLEDGAFLSQQLAQNADRTNGNSAAHRIIDEFMITANEIGANELLATGRGLYRVHVDEDASERGYCTARARYSPECKEHDGLGLTEYAHLTSPLRRYPDLVNWRILWQDADGEKGLEELAEHLNEQERYIDNREFDELMDDRLIVNGL